MIFSDIPSVLAQSGGQPSPGGQGGQSVPQGPGAQGQGQPGSAQQQQPGAGTQPTGQGGGGSGFPLLWILAIVLVGMWIFMMTNQHKEKKKKQQMQDSLQKGAKVQTVGGVIGTVVEVRDDEIVLKVDENANTRMRFTRDAIRSVTESKESEEGKSNE